MFKKKKTIVTHAHLVSAAASRSSNYGAFLFGEGRVSRRIVHRWSGNVLRSSNRGRRFGSNRRGRRNRSGTKILLGRILVGHFDLATVNAVRLGWETLEIEKMDIRQFFM